MLFECKAGIGKLLASGIDLLTDADKRPEAKQLLYSFTTDMGSDQFSPSVKLNLQKLESLSQSFFIQNHSLTGQAHTVHYIKNQATKAAFFQQCLSEAMYANQSFTAGLLLMAANANIFSKGKETTCNRS